MPYIYIYICHIIYIYIMSYIYIANRWLPVRLCPGTWGWSRCFCDDFTRVAASAWQFFVLELQWVLSQKGDCHTLWLWILECRIMWYCTMVRSLHSIRIYIYIFIIYIIYHIWRFPKSWVSFYPQFSFCLEIFHGTVELGEGRRQLTQQLLWWVGSRGRDGAQQGPKKGDSKLREKKCMYVCMYVYIYVYVHYMYTYNYIYNYRKSVKFGWWMVISGLSAAIIIQ